MRKTSERTSPNRRISVVWALVALIAAGSCVAPAPVKPAESRRDVGQDVAAVVAAHKALVRAYESGDGAAFLGLLDPTPQLVVFHPFLQNRFDGIDTAREEIPKMFARLGPSEWTDVHSAVVVEGDAAWLTGQVLVEPANRERPFIGRGTEIWVRRDDGWRLAHGHWSPNPELYGSR